MIRFCNISIIFVHGSYWICPHHNIKNRTKKKNKIIRKGEEKEWE